MNGKTQEIINYWCHEVFDYEDDPIEIIQSAKTDISMLMKIIEQHEAALTEIKSISSMWDYRHSEDNTGYGDITKLAKKALEG